MKSLKSPSPAFLSVLMIGIAVVLAGALDSWRMTRPLEDNAYIPKEEVITPEIRLLQEYVRIDTSNPPGNEAPGARFLADQLAKAGISAEIIESAPGRANVYARIVGKRPGEGLLLLNHIDVVPADPKLWTEPPFAAKTKMNMMYGRGTLDMKGIGICELFAFLAIHRTGKVPERDVVFLATADEEEGGAMGVEWLLEHRPDVFDSVKYAINEGGVTETLRDTVTYAGIEIATRQVVKLLIRSPERRPLELARIALLPLQSPQEPARVLPEVPGVLKEIAKHRIQNKDLISNIEQTIAHGDFWKLHATYKALMTNGVSLEGVRESDRGGYEFEVTLNNLPDEIPDVAIERVRTRLEGLDVKLEVKEKEGPSPITSWQTPMFAVIRGAMKKQYENVAVGPLIIPFASNDSRFLRARGIAAYGIWPFPVNLYQTWGIHGVNERVRLDWFMDGVELTTALVSRYAMTNSVKSSDKKCPWRGLRLRRELSNPFLLSWLRIKPWWVRFLKKPLIATTTTKQQLEDTFMMKITRNEKGFTLIELLIVVAIIGILAAIAIPNLLTAMQRSKQKRTMADMRSVATAWEAYATDYNAYSAAGAAASSSTLTWGNYSTFSYTSLASLVSPTYIRTAPQNDGWSRPFQYAVDNSAPSAAQEYAIRSMGKDGLAAEGGTYSAGPRNVFECDIVYSMGAFVAYPEGVQTGTSK